LLASHCRRSDSIPGQHVRFVVDKVSRGRDFSEYFGFLLSVSFHQCSIIIIIFRTILSRKTNGPSLGSFKQQWCLGKSR